MNADNSKLRDAWKRQSIKLWLKDRGSKVPKFNITDEEEIFRQIVVLGQDKCVSCRANKTLDIDNWYRGRYVIRNMWDRLDGGDKGLCFGFLKECGQIDWVEIYSIVESPYTLLHFPLEVVDYHIRSADSDSEENIQWPRIGCIRFSKSASRPLCLIDFICSSEKLPQIIFFLEKKKHLYMDGRWVYEEGNY